MKPLHGTCRCAIFITHALNDYFRYLDAHVRGGYQFLMENYVVGDKICIFGEHPCLRDRHRRARI